MPYAYKLIRKLFNVVFLAEFHACLSKHEVIDYIIRKIATVLQFKATLHLPNH